MHPAPEVSHFNKCQIVWSHDRDRPARCAKQCVWHSQTLSCPGGSLRCKRSFHHGPEPHLYTVRRRANRPSSILGRVRRLLTKNLRSRPEASSNGGSPGTQAIGRTLAVLEVFRQTARDLGISEVAVKLSLSGSTVHRIVRALAEAGYLAQNPSNERYYLARSAVLLGQAAYERLGLQRAQSVLQRVRDETGESVNLGVRDKDEMLIVIRTESAHPLRFSQEPGSRLPVHATSMGKAWLAHSSLPIETEVARLEQPLCGLTRRTITSPDELLKELEDIRARGFSFDDEEAIPGVRCVAAPVVSSGGELVAAVAIQGPAVRMPRTRLKSLAPVVLRAATEIGEVIPSPYAL